MRRAVSGREDSPPSSSFNDDEKAGKLRQRESSRVTKVFVFLGLLCLIFLVAIVKLHHTRRHGVNVRRRQAKQASKHTNLLPLTSIYRLSVEDKDGQQTSLDPYAGMVSLVVNVASQ